MKSVRFSTDKFAPRHRYEAWRMRNWPSLAPVMDTRPPKGPFHAQTETFLLGAVPITYTRISGQSYERSAAKIRSDDIDHIGILVMLSGRHVGETSNGSFGGGPGSVLIGDLGRPYAQTSSDAETVTLSLPRKLVTDQVPSLEGLHGVVLDASPGALIADHVAMLRRHLGRLDEMSGDLFCRGLMTSIAVSLEAAGLSTRRPVPNEDAALHRCQWFIDRHLADPDLDADRLAGLAGLSRSTLYRLFAAHEGIASYVRSVRLERARNALENPFDTRSLAQISHSLGFRDPAQFSRAFRAHFHATPSEMRRQGRGGS